MKLLEDQVSREAIEEWLEHPLTKWYANALTLRADDAVQNKVYAYFPGDPFRTQEAHAGLEQAIEEINFLHGVMNENWGDNEPCPLNFLVPEFSPEDGFGGDDE